MAETKQVDKKSIPGKAGTAVKPAAKKTPVIQSGADKTAVPGQTQPQTQIQQPAPATSVYKPPPGTPPCTAPAPPETPVPAPPPVEGPNYTELIQRIIADHDAIVAQHGTMQQILSKMTELVTILGTAPKPEDEYYDTPLTIITVPTPLQPNSPDSFSVLPATPGYQSENLYAALERISPKITVINDGTATLFVISSPDGKTWSSENTILTGEARTFWNVWELRLRSPLAGVIGPPTTGGVYRVTERDYWLPYIKLVASGSPGGFNPIDKASLTNQLQPAANTDILTALLGAPLTPTVTPTTFRITVAMSNGGNFSASIVNGVNPAQVVLFNVVPGPALIAGSLYTFDLLVHAGDIVDFRYSSTGGTIQILRVQEIDAAAA